MSPVNMDIEYPKARKRIAELEAISGELRAAAKNPSHIELQDIKWALKQAEATIEARESALRIYEEHGQPTWADIDRANDETPTLCGDCRHWGGEPDSFALGPCLVSGSFRAPGGLFTERDFGCVHGRKP